MQTPFFHPVQLAQASSLIGLATGGPEAPPTPPPPSTSPPATPTAAGAGACTHPASDTQIVPHAKGNHVNGFKVRPRPERQLASYDPPLAVPASAQPPVRKVAAVAVQEDPIPVANNTHNLSLSDQKLRADSLTSNLPALVPKMGDEELKRFASLAGPIAPDSETTITIDKSACVGGIEVKGNLSCNPCGDITVHNPKPGQQLCVLLVDRHAGDLCAKNSSNEPVVSFSTTSTSGTNVATTNVMTPPNGEPFKTSVFLTLRPPIQKGVAKSQKYRTVDGVRVRETDDPFPVTSFKTHYVPIFVVLDAGSPMYPQMQGVAPVEKKPVEKKPKRAREDAKEPEILPLKKRDYSDYRKLLKWMLDKSPVVQQLVEQAKTDPEAPMVPGGLFE